MNSGWYVVYALICFLNQVVCYINGFNLLTWQNWTWVGMIILSFIAGSNYRK